MTFEEYKQAVLGMLPDRYTIKYMVIEECAGYDRVNGLVYKHGHATGKYFGMIWPDEVTSQHAKDCVALIKFSFGDCENHDKQNPGTA